MSFTLRISLCLLALSLSLINPGLVQSQSVPNPSTSSETNDLAAALVRAASEEEQERLLERNSVLMNNALLAALRALTITCVQKGDYSQGLRISQLEVRIAKRIGDRKGICDFHSSLLFQLTECRDQQAARYCRQFDKIIQISHNDLPAFSRARSKLRLG
jgi:hypothetical protein